MKPAAFEYLRAETAAEAVALLHERGSDAKVLAGGQSLMAVLNMRLTQPTALIDVSRTEDLAYARVEDGVLAVGAAATQASVEWRPTLQQEVPLLAQAFPFISHFQIRNRGTICGSIAHADPSAELPLVLTALRGHVVLRSGAGRRTLAASDFFCGMLTTAREADELVEEVRFPLLRAGQNTAFAEFSARHGDFAMCAAAAVADADGLHLAVGGVADRPTCMRWPLDLSADELAGELNDLAWALDAKDDGHASARFRRHLVRRLGAQVIHRVTGRALPSLSP